MSAKETACPRCRLARSLFVSVREAAAGEEDADPEYFRTVGEILAGLELASPGPRASAAGLLSAPARFPAPVVRPPPTAARARRNTVVAGRRLALPAPSEVPRLVHQVEELVRFARREGMDVARAEDELGSARARADQALLEEIAQELRIRLTAWITQDFERLRAARAELGPDPPGSPLDAALDQVRTSLAEERLDDSLDALRRARDALYRAEEEWETVRVLAGEAELLAECVRSLGGDPHPALGPVEEGRRLARDGARREAEAVLARANVALWTVLEPLLFTELRRVRDRLVARRASGADIEPAVADLHTLAAALRKRNFLGVVHAYRALAQRLGGEGDAHPAASTAAPSRVP